MLQWSSRHDACRSTFVHSGIKVRWTTQFDKYLGRAQERTSEAPNWSVSQTKEPSMGNDQQNQQNQQGGQQGGQQPNPGQQTQKPGQGGQQGGGQQKPDQR